MPNLTDIEHTTFAMMGPIAHTPTRAMPCHCVVFHFSDLVVLLETGFGTREMAGTSPIRSALRSWRWPDRTGQTSECPPGLS